VLEWGKANLPQDFEILQVRITGQVGNLKIVVVADRTGGILLDDLTYISRALSDLLDAKDVLPGGYSLEVTSPGEDWPLRSCSDFRRNIGRKVEITLCAGSDRSAEEKMVGVITGVTDSTVFLDTGRGEPDSIPIARVDRAVKVFSI